METIGAGLHLQEMPRYKFRKTIVPKIAGRSDDEVPGRETLSVIIQHQRLFELADRFLEIGRAHV